MLKHKQLTPEFVHHIPQHLKPGILYIAPEFGTVTHSCCCGCGVEVVTPLSPTDWKILFDGETITLSPSVGNWNIPCRSHYIIDRNRVVECEPWTSKQAAQEQARSQRAADVHYANQNVEVPNPTPSTTPPSRLSRLLSILNPWN
ncbi:MAG TPA: DUF6527 family protein [Alphaproteobacteria bacterium]|nr:DUF6527 family protein [Alphaproteobacteria bacterium]